MLVDVNLLLFATDDTSPFHDVARRWLVDVLGGHGRVALPWPSLAAFVRIATNPRAYPKPVEPLVAWERVKDWLARPNVWIPVPTARHADVLEQLIRRYRPQGKTVMDADLAALAIEHGIAVASADTDFARFTEIRWINPLADG